MPSTFYFRNPQLQVFPSSMTSYALLERLLLRPAKGENGSRQMVKTSIALDYGHDSYDRVNARKHIDYRL